MFEAICIKRAELLNLSQARDGERDTSVTDKSVSTSFLAKGEKIFFSVFACPRRRTPESGSVKTFPTPILSCVKGEKLIKESPDLDARSGGGKRR